MKTRTMSARHAPLAPRASRARHYSPSHWILATGDRVRDTRAYVCCRIATNLKAYLMTLVTGPTSIVVLTCEFGDLSCPGQNADATSQCGDDSNIDDEKRNENAYCDCGYVGPLCSVCDDNYLETWAQYRACQPCGQGGSYAPLIILLSSVVLIGLSIVVCVLKIKGCKKKVMKFYRTGSVKWRILFFAGQVISQFSSISGNTGEKRKYPQPAATAAEVLGVSNIEVFSFVSLRCMMPDTHFYTTLLIKTVGPFVVLALLWTYPLFCFMIRKPSRSAWNFSARWSLVFLEVIVSATTTAIVQTLACDEFDDGHFLRVQLTLACDGSPHRRKWVIFAWLMGAVYPLGSCIFGSFPDHHKMTDAAIHHHDAQVYLCCSSCSFIPSAIKSRRF